MSEQEQPSVTTRFRTPLNPVPNRFFTISGIAIALLIASALIILTVIMTITLTRTRNEVELEEQIVSLQQSAEDLQETVEEFLAAVEDINTIDAGQIEQIDVALAQVDRHLDLIESDLETLVVEIMPEEQTDRDTAVPAVEEGVVMTAAWALGVLSIVTALGAVVVFWRLAKRRRQI